MKKVKISNKQQQQDRRRYLTYGVTAEDWKQLSQYGCQICGRTEGRICVDHIHQKGFKKMPPEEKRKYVRGALCYMCNVGLKGFDKTKDGKQNRNRLEGTYRYFQIHALKGEI